MWTAKYGVAHWSATQYDWLGVEADGTIAYHDTVDGFGRPTSHQAHDIPLHRAVAGRNNETINCAMCCMGGTPWTDYPPTLLQIDGFAKLWAKICMGRGWTKPEDLAPVAGPLTKVFTHAEVAANRDMPLALVLRAQDCLRRFSDDPLGKQQDACAQALGLKTANYGPTEWLDHWPGGTMVRWDLHKLFPNDPPGHGGIELRARVRKWIDKLSAVGR